MINFLRSQKNNNIREKEGNKQENELLEKRSVEYHRQQKIEESEWASEKLKEIYELIYGFYIDLVEVSRKTNINLKGNIADDTNQIKELANYYQQYLEQSQYRLEEKLRLYSLVKLNAPQLKSDIPIYWEIIRSVETKIRKFHGYIFNCLEGYSIYSLDVYQTIKGELDTELSNITNFLTEISQKIKNEDGKLKQ
ncbi:MAG: hypothetical protein ABEI32_05380 [Halothece sp.]